MRKTKIVCTIGPSSDSEKVIERLMLAGMNVARLNFSHGTHEYHDETITKLKKARKKLDRPLAILLDTKGPEIRLGNFEKSKVELVDNEEFTLTKRDVVGTNEIASISFKALPGQMKAGNTILIDDGKVELEVISTTDEDVLCKVVHGGMISNHKGINIPRIHIEMEYMSEQDKADVLFGIEHDVDFIAASFVRTAADVIALRKFVNYHGGHAIKIIAKIENLEGIENFDEILKQADGIMVARGDMGVEVEFERLPGLQKRFISKCFKQGKMVITATQMLESMITNMSPTRAEITDVANAVFDGTSAIMLSGETAMGKYPVRAVEVMSKIASQAETDAIELDIYKNISYELDPTDTTNAVCDAAATTSRDIKAKAVIALTMSGRTARGVSKFRPIVPIIAATTDLKTYNQLALSWGVYPVMAKNQKSIDKIFLHAVDCARQLDLVEEGDVVVIVAGIPLDITGRTNILKVEVVGEGK